MRQGRAIAGLLVLAGMLLATACARLAPSVAPPASAPTSPVATAAPSATPAATPTVAGYGFAIDPPAGATWQPIGLLASQADANSGALDATSGNLALVLVWNGGFHDATAALQAGFSALGTRGATVTTGAPSTLPEGNLDAVGRSFRLATTTGTADGFAAAWGCGQPQRTFALVARGDATAAQQAVRTLLSGFTCQRQ